MPEPVHILPRDPNNEALVANVHPADWVNPTLAGRYNLVVIGAGTAGLITSLVASTETTPRTEGRRPLKRRREKEG